MIVYLFLCVMFCNLMTNQTIKLWQQKYSYTAAIGLSDTLTARTVAIRFISGVTLKWLVNGRSVTYIATSGSASAGQYPKAIMFITRITIPQIMNSAIWNVSHLLITFQGIGTQPPINTKIPCWLYSQLKRRLSFGTLLEKGKSGIVRMQSKMALAHTTVYQCPVRCAVVLSRVFISLGFALTPVAQSIDVLISSITWNAPVKNVVSYLWLLALKSRTVALGLAVLRIGTLNNAYPFVLKPALRPESAVLAFLLGDCKRYDLCNFEYTTFKNLGHYQKR